MKEHPILFNGPMVKAILAGAKSQTRRIVKPQPVDGDQIISTSAGGWWVGRMRDSENAWRDLKCPHGKPGDTLWVRETWQECDGGNGYLYRADSDHIPAQKWKPSIFMPRWASRITLEITDIRVERLQDISEADAVAEGIAVDDCHHVIRFDDVVNWGCAISEYGSLWNQINGKGAWNQNPWVWVISFRRVSV